MLAWLDIFISFDPFRSGPGETLVGDKLNLPAFLPILCIEDILGSEFIPFKALTGVAA